MSRTSESSITSAEPTSLNQETLPISAIVRAVCQAASAGPDRLYEVMVKLSLMVEATLADGRVLRTEANNNEPSAPSPADAPILPGAWRAIRLYFRSGPSDNPSPNLRVVGCSCD